MLAAAYESLDAAPNFHAPRYPVIALFDRVTARSPPNLHAEHVITCSNHGLIAMVRRGSVVAAAGPKCCQSR